MYRADKHPDVVQGKRTEQQVLVEFLETFEAHLNVMTGQYHDGKVSLDEFTEYYRNISASIDEDSYFVLMMNNSWNVKGDANPYQKYEGGWSATDNGQQQEAVGASAKPTVVYGQ